MTDSAGVVAMRLGISSRRVRDLWLEGMPRGADQAEAWHMARKVARAAATAKTLDEARRRKTEAEAKLAEMEVAKAEGELVPITEYRARLGGIVDLVRARLLAVPGRYAPQIVGKRTMAEAVAVLEAVTTEILTDLAAAADE